jgi:hypothetical protein
MKAKNETIVLTLTHKLSRYFMLIDTLLTENFNENASKIKQNVCRERKRGCGEK